MINLVAPKIFDNSINPDNGLFDENYQKWVFGDLLPLFLSNYILKTCSTYFRYGSDSIVRG